MTLNGKSQNKGNKGRKNAGNIILVVILIAGIGLIAYPSVANWWNSFHQTRAVASYQTQVADLSQPERDRMWEDAKAYNRRLAEQAGRFNMTEAEEAEYNSLLDVTGTGIMGVIQIPKLNTQLAIYHGTSDEVLQIAIGHIPGSSLPTGGKGTHCVISGHRGLPSAKLFTNLDRMAEGDTFMLQVMDHTLTYEVDQIRIVLPEELADLEIEAGKDYCTLVTCTPYGINTHRLLVRGHRIPNEAGDVIADAMQIDPMIAAPVIAAIIIVILLAAMFIKDIRKSLRKRAEKREQEKE